MSEPIASLTPEICFALDSGRVVCKGKGDPIYLVRIVGGKMLYNKMTRKQITYLIQSAAEALRNSDD